MSPGTTWALFIKGGQYMTVAQWLLAICILIEVYHVVCHDYLKSISQPIIKRHKWAEAYKNITDGVTTLCEEVSENPDLSKHISIDALLTMLKRINEIGGPTRFRHNTMEDISLKHIGIFLASQCVEIVYWIISFVLACILPPNYGFGMFVALMILSWIHTKNDKSKNPIQYWYLADSLICNTMFIALMFA
jgi:hypothetical protein